MPSPALSGLFRSLRAYHGDPARAARMRALLGRIAPDGALAGGLAFDVGAHVGDRVSALRALGARVVAVEPQPLPLRALRLIHGRDPGVTLVPAACGAAEGEVELQVNAANPTVTTASAAFVAAADGAAGWEGQRWDGRLRVPCTTLDALIAAHGIPDFVKIDVEGFEPEVLAGLSRQVPALSFEITTIQRDAALACLDRLSALGRWRFALSLGESHALEPGGPWDAAGMAARIAALPHAANSGDVYAVAAETPDP